MKTRLAGILIGAGIAALAFSACSQASTDCTVAKAGSGYGYAAKFTLKSGTGACAELKGDVLGLENYTFIAGETPDKVDRDPNGGKLAIQSNYLGELTEYVYGPDPVAANKPYALGNFSSRAPDADNFCTTEAMAPAVQEWAEVPDDPETEEDESLPAESIRYEWSNVKVYVTAAAPGTQFSADLRFTENGCTADYHVVAMWPAVDCGTYEDTDGDGEVDTLTGIDEKLCDPEPAPEEGRPTGSGISPDFPTMCDPDLHLCVLKGEPPQIKESTSTEE